jgi:hypothetical protein
MISRKLKKFCKARERAYTEFKMLDGNKLRAIATILKVADFHINKTQSVQLRAVAQIENAILALLPSETSRYQPSRHEMLELINQSKHLRKNEQNRTAHQTTHA